MVAGVRATGGKVGLEGEGVGEKGVRKEKCCKMG